MTLGAHRSHWARVWVAIAGLTACYQTDIVALRRARDLCQGQDACSTAEAPTDAGAAPAPAECDATNSCVSQPSACTDAASCEPAPSKPVVVQRCATRACRGDVATSTFCDGDGVALLLGDSCPSADSNPEFRRAVCSQTDLIVEAPLRVQGDVAVDRDLTVGDMFMLDGELRYAGRFVEADGAQLQAGARTQSEPQCDAEHRLGLDIPALVKAAASSHDNDRATAELALLTHWTGKQSITLPCGRYYLSEINGDGSMEVQATGHVVLFVDGGVSVKQGLKIRSTTGARVTIVVNGSVHVLGGLSLGDLADARHMLVSAKQVYLEQGANTIGGLLYVQSEELLLFMGTLDVRGAVFAYRAQLEGATAVTAAPLTSMPGSACNP